MSHINNDKKILRSAVCEPANVKEQTAQVVLAKLTLKQYLK